MEKRYIRKDGSTVWVNLTGSMVRDAQGRPDYFIAVIEDIGLRKQVEEALRDSEERMRLAMAAGNIGVWDWDIGSGSVGWSDNLARLAGMVPGTVAGGIEAFRALVHPEDRPGIDDALDAALSGRSELNVEFRMIRLDGGLRWLATRAIVLRDPSGRPVRMVGIDRDITGRKEAEERQQRLASELDHRVRNIVAVIGAIASQTLAAGPERKALLGRLKSLANAHRLLTASQWESVDVAALVRQELAPYPADRVACDGPPLAVPSRIAQTLALVLHELATNAAKYGALSVPTGRVDTRWSVRAADKPVLELIWSESGGAPVKAPLKRGFGTRLIERSAASEGGKAELMFRPEGLQMRLTIPLQRGMA